MIVRIILDGVGKVARVFSIFSDFDIEACTIARDHKVALFITGPPPSPNEIVDAHWQSGAGGVD